jgi:hypothetical protein
MVTNTLGGSFHLPTELADGLRLEGVFHLRFAPSVFWFLRLKFSSQLI